MEDSRLRFSRWSMAVSLLGSALLLAVCLFVGLYSVLEVLAWASGWPAGLIRPAAEGWMQDWPPVFALVGVPFDLYFCGAIPLGYVTILSTVLGEDGVSQRRPPIMRRKRIAWSDVTVVERSEDIFVVKIRSSSRYIWVKLYFYKYPREVEQFIEGHAPLGTRFTGDMKASPGV